MIGDVRVLQVQVFQLRQALASRVPLEQAKGMLMLHFHLDADAASRLVQQWSRAADLRPRQVAQVLLHLVGDGVALPKSPAEVLALVFRAGDEPGTVPLTAVPDQRHEPQ